MGESRNIQVYGYRRVFRIERRLFRFERWRIPYPHGVPLRGIGYFLLLEVVVVLLSRLPLTGTAIGLATPGVAFLALPVIGSFLLLQVRIDGRPPHHVLASVLGWILRPRSLAGLDPCPPAGEQIVPVDEIAVAYDCREAFAVAGRIQGPASITFRYPSAVRIEGAPPWVRDPRKRTQRARRFRVQRRGSTPMLRGKVLRIPRGKEVVVE